MRDAIVRRDPDALVRCFSPQGAVRVPRREGDLVIRGRTDLARAGIDLRATIRELSWTPSRRFVSAGEVTEEAVVVAHLYQGRAGRAAAPPPSQDGLRVPLRAVATLDPDGLISALTLWLDWAALSDPRGVASAEGAASALVALARSRDDRGLQVLRTPPQPVIVDREVSAEVEPEPDRPKPMSRGAVWWELHRAGVAGSAMALVAVLLLTWVGLNVLAPLRHDDSSVRSAGVENPELGTFAGADAQTSPSGSGSVSRSGSAGGAGTSGKTDTSGKTGTGSSADASGAGTASSNNAEGPGAPVLSAQKPNVKPTVQRGEKVTFLSDVLFRFGSFELSVRAQNRLDRFAGQIREAGVTGDIQVNGYTDSIGSVADNMELSKQRALAVANALSQRLDGVAVRLHVQAFGESSPRATNNTDAGRRQNRRVIVVLPEKH